VSGREEGFAAVEWTLGIGLLILPLVIAVASIAPMLARLNTARVMAQEAARVLVLADDWDGGTDAAMRLARQIARNRGIRDAEWCTGGRTSDCVSVTITGTTPGALTRGSEVFVDVQIPTPAVAIPFAGEVGSLDLHGTHTERVDDYRSFP
jgi:hypothetical protein